MTRFARRLLVEEQAATMVEYALMLGLISLSGFAVVYALSQAINARFDKMSFSLK